jgi:type II secretory pathway predicted ATPase ExeA
MGKIRNIDQATNRELEEYLTKLGWSENPFAHPARLDEYVLPETDHIADITAQVRSYTGPILIHSRYSGAGKTTLLKMLLTEYEPDHNPIYLGEHNVTPHELVSIVAAEMGITPADSTKLTEQKIRNRLAHHDGDPYLLGIDEFGLNDPDTLHVIQFLNDLEGMKVILTGMSSQWHAIAQLGTDGRAFQRRVAYQLELEPFDDAMTVELVTRRIAAAKGVDYEDATIHPFQPEALGIVQDEAGGVPGVVSAACSELVTLGAYQYANGRGEEITPLLANAIDYADGDVEAVQQR